MASSKPQKGLRTPAFQIAQKDALAKTRTMIAEGDQKGEDRHDWSFEIRSTCPDGRILRKLHLEAGQPRRETLTASVPITDDRWILLLPRSYFDEDRQRMS